MGGCREGEPKSVFSDRIPSSSSSFGLEHLTICALATYLDMVFINREASIYADKRYIPF
jgi:hypothetical protein